MNSVAFAERSKVAKHESVHAAAAWLLGVVSDEIKIVPLDGQSGYLRGSCLTIAKPSINALVTACGCVDGHGIRGPNEEGDEYELARLVTDECERACLMDVARQVMSHAEYLRVRNALWRRLQHRDHLLRDEIHGIAASATGFPDAVSRIEASSGGAIASDRAPERVSPREHCFNVRLRPP